MTLGCIFICLLIQSGATLKFFPQRRERFFFAAKLAAQPNIPDALPFDPFAGGVKPPGDVLPRRVSRFLTQRAVQQQLYYYELNLDETSANFLSEFLRAENSSRIHPDYHGINSLPTRDSATFICALLAYPEIDIKIRKPMGCAAGRGHGGINGATGLPITRNANPYLQQRYFEYVETLRPPDTSSKLMTIRKALASELAADAVWLRSEGEALANLLMFAKRKSSGSKRGIRRGGGGSGTGEESGGDEPVGGRTDSVKDIIAFEVPPGFTPNENTDMSDGGGGRSSPFRLANFDLFKLLLTRDAIETVASSSKKHAKAAKRVLDQWLPEINGHSRWTRGTGEPCLADKVVSALVGASNGVGNEALALDVLDQRSKAAKRWERELLGSVEQEQVQWQRWHLGRTVTFSVGDANE
mmetsp:Transcript_35653/g.72666  ORF Transcript_35653/g.72666 Transcript_35653/m.72666 type:complete len:413 (-) Transcript_35653:216-1454(-)|eukprot:CAMPEP_0171742874 /NCGR_PEP_ID=MMETSP0991-20121206/36523_1 /TAXON_ID=483369 /ORGANISM="non described non described, Strain CCMP2098" /LENGTH=412 /DNA_ID=CAMNT_0012341635 /DNA_START=27 /DNA_END=1265 /DNA_ORIENTATION=+